MRKKIRQLTFITVAAATVMTACNQSTDSRQQPKNVPPPLVEVQTATESTITSYLDITGTVQANIFTDVKSPVNGILESLHARENQWVEKGGIIAVINPDNRLALIADNQLQIEKLEQQLKDNINSSVHDSLSQELEKAKANLEYAKDIYQTIPVICPMDGMVIRRWVKTGSQVDTRGKIITVSDMSSLVIKSEVNEKYLTAIKKGRKLEIVLSAYPGDTLTGIISLVYPVVDPATRSIRFDIRIQESSKQIFEGMMASVKIPVDTKEDVIAVPEKAVLVSTGNQPFIYVLGKDSLVHHRNVETGIRSENRLEISSGLEEGEKIIVKGQEMLQEGIKVKVSGNKERSN
ncbi:MAG: efflux RND transporter periplasmic adaptor subunit [Bacteroidota bacterium]|nr:efflux RND transporter periplasmic adaptor subunit [Bacteroidota bacterium]